MAAVAIHSDIGAKKIKSVTVFIVSPYSCHEVLELDAMILVFWRLSFKPVFSLSSFTFIKRFFFFFFFFSFFLKFYFIFKLYITVLVLPNIKMNPPQVYMKFLFAFCHKGGVICISEVIDISPSNLDSRLCFFQHSLSHDILCI